MPPKEKVWLFGGKNPAEPYCPACGKLNDAYTYVSRSGKREKPEAGDVSLCAYCGVLCMFTAHGGLRFPTADEVAKIMQDPLIRKLLTNGPVAGGRFGP